MAVEPSSLWERVYLLWTFRNFRQLSPLLLNPRQAALINKLFFQHAAVFSDDYEPRLQIGVVENFVPPAIEIDAAPGAIADASMAMQTKLPEPAAGENAASEAIPIAASLAMTADGPPAMKEEKAETEGLGMDLAGFARKNVLDRSFGPIVSRLKLAASNLPTFKLVVPRPQVSKPAIFRFAAAIGALSLCAYFAVAFHQIGGAPGSPPHIPPTQFSSPDSPSAPTPAPVAENQAPAPEAPAQPIADPETEVKTAPESPETPDQASADREAPVETRVKSSPAKVALPATTTEQTTVPEHGSGGTAARVARSSGESHAAAFSRVPAYTSTHRMTLPPEPRGAMASSAKSYFDLAKRQMAKGNYAAAAAEYKRAWRIEEFSAAAKGRLVRARRGMLAKNERATSSFPNR